jgi:Tol biopolymer transport system component
MPDDFERLRELDRFEPPDVWSDIERLGPKTPVDQGPSKLRRMAVALVALGIAASSFLLVNRAFRTRVMVQPGETPSGSISSVGPAGNGLIAFNCGYQICTAMPDGSRYTNLIEGYDKDLVVTAEMPVFSSDGSKIAFVGYDHEGSSSPGGGANYDIYVMSADGTGLTNLTTSPEDAQSGDSQGSPHWSPDGSTIAYSNFTRDRASSGVYLMNTDGTDQHKIAGGGDFLSWSPDGSRIVFVLDDGLWTVHPDGTGIIQLTHSPSYDDLPTWSPDGSRIAFVREGAIYVVNADGTGVRDVVDVKGLDPFQPQWSPDGTQLAFEAGDSTFDIYLVNADGTGLTAIAHDPKLDENWPVWSPDGALITYAITDDLSGVNDGTWDLYVMRPDGSDSARLTKDAHLGAEFDISWQRTIG